MLNKYEIQKLILLNSISENAIESEINDSPKPIKIKFLAGKVLIDRWGHGLSDTIYISKSRQETIDQELSTDEEYINSNTVWGSRIYYVDGIPDDKVLMLCLDHQLEDEFDSCHYFAQLRSGELIASTNIAVISL
jgi:hypothetical protein